MAVDVNAFSALARAEFMEGKLAVESRVMPAKYEPFVTKITSKVKVETQTFMSSLPRLQEFKGHTPSVRLTNKEYTVANKDYRIGMVNVKKTDLDDDQIGGYLRSIQAIPATGERDIGFKILSHLAAGTSTACFDGTNFFANSHTVGSGDNLDTFNAASNDGATHKIIALVTNNAAMKPVLFQDRESLSALMTDADTPQALKLKEFEYWADCRFGLGYGYWWDAIHMTITDTPTVAECYDIVRQIINLFRTFTLPKGNDKDDALYVHEGWDPSPTDFKLLCNLNLGEILKTALTISQYVTSTGNVDNVYKGVGEVIPTSALN
jgi:phage major head subunit gpT-like protein